jgi:hypothetical protein
VVATGDKGRDAVAVVMLVCAGVTGPGKIPGDAPVPESFGRRKKYPPAAIIRRRKIAAMIGTGFLFFCSGGAGITGEILKPWLAGNRG